MLYVLVGLCLLYKYHQMLTIQIGQTGLGKSTLINTIFASHLIDSKGRMHPEEPVRATTEIQAVSHGRSLNNLCDKLFC